MTKRPIRRDIRLSLALIALLGSVVSSCAGGSTETGSRERSSVAAPWATGSLELGDTSYPFTVSRCDLTGSSEDGILLSGGGTLPDGRRMSVEVERLRPGDAVLERASVFFGPLIEGDHWEASMRGSDNRWFSDDAGAEPVDGPLIRISGSELVVESTFRHDSDKSTRRGTLRARCDGTRPE